MFLLWLGLAIGIGVSEKIYDTLDTIWNPYQPPKWWTDSLKNKRLAEKSAAYMQRKSA